MPISPRLPDAPPDPLAARQRRRLCQVLWLLVGAFVLVIGINLASGAYRTAEMEGLIASLLLVALPIAHRSSRGAVALAAVSLLLGLIVLIVHNQGLYDEAVLALPALLLFAGMFGSRRMFLGLAAVVLAAIVALFFLHQGGLVVSQPLVPMDWRRPFVIGLILTVTALFVWLIVRDLDATVRQLEEEKEALEQSHAQIEILAQRDSLTSLPNRALAKDRLTHLLTQARRNGGMVAVLFLDLDNFKTINDSLGHIAGDALLCQVADTLRDCVRESDTVARVSGDEFLILLGGLQDEDAIVAAVAKLTHRLGQAFPVEGVDVLVTASLGIAVAPRDGGDTDTLLKHADMAMYRAKDAGRNTFRFFDPSMNESVVEQLHLASGLRSALGSEQLMLHYQPQLELASGRIVGAEALLRWRHPEHGWISPARFIPVAERSGLIHELGAWVLRQACLDAQSWRELGLGALGVAVNVSAVQFRRDGLEREVARALASSGLPAQALELELTESLLMADASYLGDVLQRLSSHGVQIAIDDFGTGYSNLGYLRHFAVDRLKVDQSFVRRMTSNPHDEGLVRAIIEMGHCLGLQVVAEGVEDAQTLARLLAFGCERGQGFHWSPALPPQDFIAFVQAHQARG
ncbi:putative bifunctional diguanylate cyclase/phosphodiesterase [Thermomonas sp.]|uniref:putative bifunctional diguanylate cyclase/phosphodiesterase n=1 Tax=Thermomonas sp. TaxID=1971895 RepID=UPI003D0DDD22